MPKPEDSQFAAGQGAPKESLTELYDDAPVGYFSALPDGTILRLNRTLTRWTGWTADQVLGQRWQERLLTRAGRTLVETHLQPLIALCGEAREISLDLIRADGQRFAVLLYVERRTPEDGTTPYNRFTLVEATDRRRYERRLLEAKHAAEEASESLRELAADLERRVEERTASLENALGELDAFSYAVSHDLRAPLRSVLGFSKLLREDYGASFDRDGADYLMRIEQAGLRMSELIDGLLQLAQGSRGELHLAPTDISQLAQAQLEQLAQGSPERDVQWSVEPGVRVMADGRLMDSMLRNLLGNAWKYTARTAHAVIRLYTQVEDTRRYVCIGDNGAGFDPQDAHLLFQPFRRLHEASEFPGSGIGLSTVERIIKRHRGVIDAQGAPGQGATFRFWLPGSVPGEPY